MKVTFSFKDPEALFEGLSSYSEEEQESIREVTKKFFKYGEYVKIEIDTEAKTATVIQQ